MMFALVVSFMKIKAGKSTLAVAIVNTIYYVVVATFIIVFLLQDTLWTNVVYEHITKQVIDAVTLGISMVTMIAVLIHVYFIWMKTIKK